jgi:hypothetical protein
MFAAGAVSHTRFVTIYGMAQCTRDTAADDCSLCLALAIKTIPICCDGKEGGRIFVKRCSLRFEIYPFYNEQAAEAAMSPAPVNGSDDLSRPQRSSQSNLQSLPFLDDCAFLTIVPTPFLMRLLFVCRCHCVNVYSAVSKLWTFRFSLASWLDKNAAESSPSFFYKIQMKTLIHARTLTSQLYEYM